MKNFIKLAAVGVAGYLIGFYEMKYKVVKTVAEASIKKELNESKGEEEGF